MNRTRSGFSLIELLVVIAIIGTLAGLLLSGLQKAREAATRVACQNNLKQLGLALHMYHDANNVFPPGLICSTPNVSDGETSGYTHLLPFLEQNGAFVNYHLDQSWWDQSNQQAVATQIKVLYCPSNRGQGQMDLTKLAKLWHIPTLPPVVGSCDYAFCKGANASLTLQWQQVPLAVRGVFGVCPPEDMAAQVHMVDIVNNDGTSHTFLMGDAAGGTRYYETRDLNNPEGLAYDVLTGKPGVLEQAWGAPGITDAAHPWYASIFAVTAQYGLGADPRDEPMNRRPGTPTVFSGYGKSSSGDNRSGKDVVSGFRSVHSRGCNFVFADGSVHFIASTIRSDVYRALSTYAGGETISEGDY